MAMVSLYSVYVLTLALLLYMVFLLVSMSGSKAASAFLCVVISEILIIFGMMLEMMMGSSVAAALVCLKLQYVGQAIFLMSLLYFCSIFLHIHIPQIVYAVQFVVNTIVLIGCITAEHHTLFYSSMAITTADAPYPTIKVTDGPIWYLHYTHLFLVQLAVIVIAFLQYGKSNSRQKARSVWLLAGLGTETVELILKGAGLFGSFNPFVVAAFVFSVCLYIGIIRYGYFDTVEVAMSNALSNSTEGFLVADNEERVLYLNAQMKKLFPGLRVNESIRYAELVADIFDGQRELHQDGVYYKAVLEDVREGNLCDGKMLRLIEMTDYYERIELLRRESENKTDFLSHISHEIRTPLNTINGMNEMILRECRDERILTYAQDIREAEEILMSLIGDVLDVTSIEQSEIILDESDFDARRLLRRLWCAAEVKCDKKGLALDFVIAPDLPAVWYADEARVYQIAENLLSNAIKYTDRGSVVLTVGRGADGTGIALAVEDTGIGIPEEAMERIFHRFEQLQTSSRRQGLGLGLEIVKSLVETMGGQITVESRVGRGSRFTVTLPLALIDGESIGADWKKLPAGEAQSHTLRCENKRVLVVDDNEMNRRVMRQFLERSGVEMDEADSGPACLAMLEQGNPYDLFFLDHMMPGMDGIELFHKITALPCYQAHPVPAIALTANAIKGAKQLYLAEGFDDYLAKPFDPQVLFDMLGEYLNGTEINVPDGAAAEPAPTSVLLSRLAALGMDTDAALRYAGHSRSFLLEELALFLKYEPQTARAMDADARGSDWNALAVRVHGLKNNFAALGFTALAAQAKTLELALRESGDAAGYADLAENYQELTQSLRGILDAEGTAKGDQVP